MNKLESLQYLEKLGLNVHNYAATHLGNRNEECVSKGLGKIALSKAYSVRFDTYTGDCLQLPFVVLEKGEFDFYNMLEIRELALRLGCYVILSDGRNYDKYLEYNIVCKLEENGDFICEVSTLKIPLRHMYNHPLTCIIGNIIEPIHWWTKYETTQQTVNYLSVLRHLTYIYSKEIFGKFIECTTYTKKVGTMNKDIVFWHIWG